jgi:hypothetical protein
MQTFDELEHKLLNQHGDEYKSFTRLLLTLSVACLTVLASNNFKPGSSLVLLLALSLQFISVLFGVFVQHRIMMNPIYHLQLAQKSQAQVVKNQDETAAIKILRKPTNFEQIFYRLQCASFILAFFFLALYAIPRAT